MAVNSIIPAYPFFHDLSGDALEAGYIYIGQSGQNAEANPVTVYWDEGLTIPAPQPIRTLAGRPSRNGTPAAVYASGDYSIIVKDKRGRTVYTALHMTLRVDTPIAEAGLPVDPGALLYRVPTDFATVQEALDAVQGIPAFASRIITIFVETGFEWPRQVTVFGGDFSNVLITSEDATVSVAADFPANDALITFTSCRAPRWGLVVDMDGEGDNGVELVQSHMLVNHRCGVINAGANGSPHREAWGSNFLLINNSSLTCDPIRETEVSRTGHNGAGSTTLTFPLAAADATTDQLYWIGAILTVSNGADTSAAHIVDYDVGTNTVTIARREEWSAPNDGAGLSYTIDRLQGLIATGAARRGVTATWGSFFSVPAADLKRCGTDPRDTGHCGLFVSRSSWGQCDYAVFCGSARGIRSGRSNLVSARNSELSFIDGTAISASEGSSVSAAASSFRRSGLIGTGGAPDLTVLFLNSAEGRGGSGTIDAPGGEFDYAIGPVARIDSEAGKIDIGDSWAYEIGSYLATADGGNVDCTRIRGTTAADAAADHVIFASSLDASAVFIGANWDAQNGANYIARVANDGRVNVSNATIANAITRPFDVDEAGRLYVEDVTIDGVAKYGVGFELGPGAEIPTRDDAVDAIADGWIPTARTTFRAGGYDYIVVSGSSAISDMPNVMPVMPALPGHYGAAGDGSTNDTSAITAFLASCTAMGVSPHWDGRTHAVTGNLPSLLSYSHTGSGIITRGSDTFYIGEGWQGDRNIIYVSASGSSTNDGLTPSLAMDLTNGWNALIRQARIAPAARWRLQLAAGTYPNGPSRRLENFPTTDFRVEIFGASVAAPNDVPTTIFDGWTVNIFRKLDGAQALQFHFRDLLFQDCSGGQITLHHGMDVLSENLHCDGCSGDAFWYRDVKLRHSGGRIENGSGGIVAQSCYGETGETSSLADVSGVVFNGIVDGGDGECIQYSRGTVAYVRQCSFGVTSACDIHISTSRLARVRTQDNTHGAFNTSIFRTGSLTVWNDDADNLDDFSGSGAVVGSTPVIAEPGAYISRVHQGYNRQGHLQQNSAAPFVLTGTARTAISSDFVPFRMPAYWLMAPSAAGWVEYEFLCPVAETITVEIAGDSSSTARRWAYRDFSPAGFSRWLLRFEFTGPTGGGNQGRFVAEALGPIYQPTSVGQTGQLNDPTMTAASVDPLVSRVYITRSDGTGDLQVLRMASWVSV